MSDSFPLFDENGAGNLRRFLLSHSSTASSPGAPPRPAPSARLFCRFAPRFLRFVALRLSIVAGNFNLPSIQFSSSHPELIARQSCKRKGSRK